MDLSRITEEFYFKGLEDEDKVMTLTKYRFGGSVEHATKKEDIFDHIDFWWYGNNGEKIGFDVKGLRKNKRSDKYYDDTIQWVELQNVNGRSGWVYGKADYITFMTKRFILYVPRKMLAEYVEMKVRDVDTVHSIPSDCYIPYQRSGRLDKIVKVPTIDLIPLSKYTLKYAES